MNISQRGIDLIKSFEGFRPTPYVCPGGIVTIGYGTTRGVRKDMRVTEAEAEILLRNDVARTELVVSKLVRVPINQNQFDALVSFTYNVGEAALADSTLLRVINAGDYQAAPDQFRRWVRAKGIRLEGLVTRRNKEAELFVQA